MVWKPFPLSKLFPNESPYISRPSDAGSAVNDYGSEEAGSIDDEASTYDYIVIGSGTAGSIIANRLSEKKPAAQVLVLEAGHRVNDFISTIPLFAILRSVDPRYSNKIKTVPQIGLNGRKAEVLSGRVVGGSSAINAGLYTRGTNREIDEWESKFACQGWNHRSLEPYFDLPLCHDLSESATLKASFSQELSERGPWEYSLRKDHLYPITEHILSALDEKGVRRNDSNPYEKHAGRGPLGSGSFVIQSSISSNGRKIHAGNAYLSDEILASRKNLKLCTGARVVKLHLKKENDGSVTAKGVYLEDDKKKCYYAAARCKVILCAGVLQTPQLLLLSGIGPKAELDRHFIESILEHRDIGKNLQDHLGVPLHFFIPNSLSSASVSDRVQALPQFIKNMYNYYGKQGDGVFSSPGFMEASAWLNINDMQVRLTNHSKGEEESEICIECKDPHSTIGNIEILFSSYWLDWAQTRYKGFHDVDKDGNKRGIMGMYVILTQPKSKGSILLCSDDPHQDPSIDINYLNDEDGQDIEILRKGIKFALDLAIKLGRNRRIEGKADYFEISPADVPGWDNKLGKYTIPNVLLQSGSAFIDPEEIPNEMYDEFIRSRASPIYHGTSTCRMGGKDCPVDPLNMKIRGTTNLHVFDASVFPTIPSTHPQSLVFAGAEKVAEILVDQT